MGITRVAVASNDNVQALPCDKPLSFHWKVVHPAWVEALDLPSLKPKAKEAAASILLDAWVEAVGEGRWISYSRRKEFYSGMQRYYGTAYSYSTVPTAVEVLAD